MSVNVHTKISQCAFTDFGIPKAEKVEQKEGLKIMFKWRFFFLDIILDGEIFTYLKNKRLLWIVGKKFNVSFFKLEQYTISGDLQLVILTHLELIFHIPRNRWFAPEETENFSWRVTFQTKMQVILLEISFSSSYFSHIFAIAKISFSKSRLWNVENFWNVNINVINDYSC